MDVTGLDENLNWDAVRQRIAEIGRALEESSEVAPEERAQILQQRAADLAAAPVEEDTGEHIRLVWIRLGREIYGIEAQYVFTIKPAESITRVPRTPEWVTGVINLRGRIFSVVDLRRFFGLPPAEVKEGAEDGQTQLQLVVVETPDMEIGLLVDEVLTVETTPVGQLQDASGIVRGLRSEYVKGVIPYPATPSGPATADGAAQGSGYVLIVLDLPALLRDERLIIHEEVI